jgi:tetratricopeptide (TPR) repeat protein
VGQRDTLFRRVVAIREETGTLNTESFYVAALLNLGLMEADLGQFGLAVEYLERALTLGAERSALVCHALGCSYFITNRPNDALPILREAVAHNNEDYVARHFLTLSLVELSRGPRGYEYADEARAEYESLRTLAPSWARHLAHHFEAR